MPDCLLHLNLAYEYRRTLLQFFRGRCWDGLLNISISKIVHFMILESVVDASVNYVLLLLSVIILWATCSWLQWMFECIMRSIEASSVHCCGEIFTGHVPLPASRCTTNSLESLLQNHSFWATVTSNSSPMLWDRCPVRNIGVLWPYGWMDPGVTWYGSRPRPRWHCVRWGPSSPLLDLLAD